MVSPGISGALKFTCTPVKLKFSLKVWRYQPLTMKPSPSSIDPSAKRSPRVFSESMKLVFSEFDWK